MLRDLDHEAEDLLRYRAELGRRLAKQGVRDVPSLLSTYDQLRRASAVVSRQEIEWATERVTRLTGELQGLARQLEALCRLKQSVER